MNVLDGKVALVTGASRGIGEAIAVALAQAGAVIAVSYRTRAADAARVKQRIEAAGGRAVTVAADVSRKDEVDRLVRAAEDSLGAIGVLVNNAGIARPQRLEEITEQDWDELLAVNLKSAFLVTQAVLPGMRARHWGRIINVSSVAADVGGIVGPHYAASKAGMHGLTHSYASLLAREGITANSIAPALIETEMVKDNPRARPDLIPVGRFGRPEEIGEVAVMLAANGYLTGQTIRVNGGWYLS